MATSEEIKSHIITTISQSMDKFLTSQETDKKRQAIAEIQYVGINALVFQLQQELETFKKMKKRNWLFQKEGR